MVTSPYWKNQLSPTKRRNAILCRDLKQLTLGQSVTMKTINKEFLKKFESYDNHIRPNPEEPLEVTITLLVQSWNQIIIFTKKIFDQSLFKL